jgi:serine/threonine protein phosphatase 1
MRTLAFGDIHGCSTALDALLNVVRPVPGDRLIFLGDYVDRGPDTAGVIERMLLLQQSLGAICLRGNHEVMMTRARRDRSERKNWLSVGGVQAMASYGGQEIPEEHWQFLEEKLLNYYETETHIFVHANLYAELPLQDQPDDMLFWEFLKGPIRHVSGKRVICGHTSQKSGVPLVYPTTVCIDTKCYANGWLTCLDVNREKYWQSNLFGQTREGDL